jgi:hypothetical protein
MKNIQSKAVLMVLAFMAVLAAGSRVLGVMHMRLNALDGEIATSRRALRDDRLLLVRKSGIEARYQRMFPAEKAAEDASAGAALKAIEETAKSFGLKMADIRRSEDNSAKSSDIIVELKLTGTEEAHVKFVYALQQSQLLFTIKDFLLRTDKETGTLNGRYTIGYVPME